MSVSTFQFGGPSFHAETPRTKSYLIHDSVRPPSLARDVHNRCVRAAKTHGATHMSAYDVIALAEGSPTGWKSVGVPDVGEN